jgi:purine-binding chemotaxis protein CheW
LVQGHALEHQDEQVTSETRQFLTFLLAGEEYGVDILRVQEIRGWERASEIPNTPHYVRGVINLRGLIVPVVDLRARFGLAEVEYGPTTVVILVLVQSEKGPRPVGMVVDAVSEVYDVPPDAMKPPPDFGASATTAFVKGLATMDDKMIIVLEIDELLDGNRTYEHVRSNVIH